MGAVEVAGGGCDIAMVTVVAVVVVICVGGCGGVRETDSLVFTFGVGSFFFALVAMKFIRCCW